MRSYVHVKFKRSDTKSYVYLAEGSVEELANCNQAVVDSPYSGRTIVDVIKVEALDESNYDGAYKYVIAMYDDRPYYDRVERQNKRKAIEKEMNQRINELKKQKSFADELKGDAIGEDLLSQWELFRD